MAEYVYFYALKLEIDEGLDLGTLHLDNQIYYNDHEEGFSYEGKPGNESYALALPTIRHKMQGIAQEHEGKNKGITCNELWKNLRREMASYLRYHVDTGREINVTEEYPAETHEVEGYQHSKESLPAVTFIGLFPAQQTAIGLMERQRHTVHHTPTDEIPGGSVPQTTQKHGNDEGDVLANLSLAITT